MRQPYPEDLTAEHKKKIKTPKPKATHVPKKNKNQQESDHDDNEHDADEDEEDEEDDSKSKKSKKTKASVEAKYEAKLAAAPKESKKARNAPKETKDLVQQQTKHDYGEDIDMEESKIEDLVHESLRKPAAKRKAETVATEASEGTKKAKKEKKTKTEGDSDDEDASPDTNKDGSKKSDDPERQARTAFVGNLAVSSMTKGDFRKLKSTFAVHGPVESIRFRSIAFAELLPRKIAFITGKLHPERDVVNAYIVYKSKDSVAKAVAALNGQLFLNKHIRVDTVAGAKVCHRSHGRLGNLNFYSKVTDRCLPFLFGEITIEPSTQEECIRRQLGFRCSGGGSLELLQGFRRHRERAHHPRPQNQPG